MSNNTKKGEAETPKQGNEKAHAPVKQEDQAQLVMLTTPVMDIMGVLQSIDDKATSFKYAVVVENGGERFVPAPFPVKQVEVGSIDDMVVQMPDAAIYLRTTFPLSSKHPIAERFRSYWGL